ncbi:hypothetical protein EBU95_16540 [bacterium]|nr:hypothetical protein [bacterium]
MPWISEFSGTSLSPNFRWDLITSVTPNILQRDSSNATQNAILKWRGTNQYQFKAKKTYIWKTEVSNFNSASQSKHLRLSPPFKPGATFSFIWNSVSLNRTLPIPGENRNTLIYIDSPLSDLNTNNEVIYGATPSGMNHPSGIISQKLIESDWIIQGYSFATSSNSANDHCYEGWRYDEFGDSFEFQHSATLNKRLPLCLARDVLSGDINTTAVNLQITFNLPPPFNGTFNLGVTYSNFISKYIETENFNLTLDTTIAPNSYINAYLFTQEPIITKYVLGFADFLKTGQLIASFTQSGQFEFYNLTGNTFLTFVSEYKNTNLAYRNTISNINIIGGYSTTDNNEEFVMTNSNIFQQPIQLSPINPSPTATYSAVVTSNQTRHNLSGNLFGPQGGTGSFAPYFSDIFGNLVNLNQINSKIGNAKFNSGIWENGVWNNGLRIDTQQWQFSNVDLAILMTSQNVGWRIQISGPTTSVVNFEIGDKVSISNIVAIDINDERKLLKNLFTIVLKSDTFIIVEMSNNFPIRRIEKDSTFHKIMVTKNVWLNGAFLNGYFEGIWNNGLFRGYPYITEMWDSHWIDGQFRGGRFHSENIRQQYADTYYYNGFVGLTFGSTAHNFIVGDEIEINKFDKTVNSSYDGIHNVTEVIDDYLIITDIPWESNSLTDPGLVRKTSNTGLVQHVEFFDENVAPKTSKTSTKLDEIWRYNSWMDLTHKTQSSTNIGSNKILFNAESNDIEEVIEKHRFGFGDYTALNLYGYITEDILSSKSRFRDIDSPVSRFYSLGTKYQIYQDFLGEISEFSKPFNSNPEVGNLSNFVEDGWTWSFSGNQATYSFVNRYLVKKSSPQTLLEYDNLSIFPPAFGVPNSGTPTWTPIVFNTLVEDTFGLLISASTSNTEWTVLTSGQFDINVSLPASLEVKAKLFKILGDAYLRIPPNSIFGTIRLLRWVYQSNSWEILKTRTIKNVGGDINVGEFNTSLNNSVSYLKSLQIKCDWTGSLTTGDRIKVEFQVASTEITSNTTAGPWRGVNFLPLTDVITDSYIEFNFNQNSTITISNSGVEKSLGFNIKRSVNKTLQYESDREISFFTLNNSNINIENNRYSMIEFDILRQPDSFTNLLTFGTQSIDLQFHTIDLYNFTSFVNEEGVYTPYTQSLSIYSEGIDYKYTGSQKVTEYFFNRPGLDLGLLNFQSLYNQNTEDKIHELDNIKFYEVDMIPFFQYTTEDYVNKQIQVPFVGVAPVIDYSDENFQFISNIQIGLDSIGIESTNVNLSGTLIYDIQEAPQNIILRQ